MLGAKSKLGTAPEMSSNAEPSQVAATATPEPGHIDMSSAMAQNHRPTKSSSQLVGRRLKLFGTTTIYIYKQAALSLFHCDCKSPHVSKAVSCSKAD